MSVLIRKGEKMNKFIFSGFISSDIKGDDVKLKSGETMRKCSFNIACQRKTKDKSADFPRVTALGKNAENIEKFFSKGQGIEVSGHVQTGSFEGKNGKVYTTDFIIDEFEFAKTRKSDEQNYVAPGEQSQSESNDGRPSAPDEFMDIPSEDIESLPFRK